MRTVSDPPTNANRPALHFSMGLWRISHAAVTSILIAHSLILFLITLLWEHCRALSLENYGNREQVTNKPAFPKSSARTAHVGSWPNRVPHVQRWKSEEREADFPHTAWNAFFVTPSIRNTTCIRLQIAAIPILFKDAGQRTKGGSKSLLSLYSDKTTFDCSPCRGDAPWMLDLQQFTSCWASDKGKLWENQRTTEKQKKKQVIHLMQIQNVRACVQCICTWPRMVPRDCSRYGTNPSPALARARFRANSH